jgi:hypothetical protein
MRVRFGCKLAIMLAIAGIPVGCAQPGPILGRRTTVGTLKASVSQLEFEKTELSKELADLKADNRRMEDRLAQEEEANGELTARLDDARVLLRGRGFDSDSFSPPARRALQDEGQPPARKTPRQGRKPPVARIPGRIDPVNSSDEQRSADDPFDTPSSAESGSLGPQSRRDTGSAWMPVARGNANGLGPVR